MTTTIPRAKKLPQVIAHKAQPPQTVEGRRLKSRKSGPADLALLAREKDLAILGEPRGADFHRTGLMGAAPVGYVVLDSTGKIEEMNAAWVQLMGTHSPQASRQYMANCVVREDAGRFLSHLRRCRALKQKTTTELKLRQKTGPSLAVEFISVAVEDPKDKSVRYPTAIVDLTHRRQTEAALSLVQQDHQALIDSIQGLVWEGREQGGAWRFTFVSKQTEKLLGYPAQRWLMESDFWEHRIHAEDRADTLAARAEALSEGKDHVLEYRLLDARGQVIWVRDSVNVRKSTDGYKLHGILIPITELKQMESALRQVNNELETRVEQRTAALARTCLELHDEFKERKRLEEELLRLTEAGRRQQGVDVHGEVGQSLAGIAMMIKSLGAKLERISPSEAVQAERIHSLVDQTMASVHDPALDLVSFGIKENTLPRALEGLAARVQVLFNIPCRFQRHSAIPVIPLDVFEQVYHISLEAVVDAIKFSEAKRVDISLTQKGGEVVLTVQHDGHPFPTPLHPSLDLGLKLMHYRAKLIGASLQIDDRARNRPLLRCVLPGSPRKKEPATG